MALVEELHENYSIDPNIVYLTGRSMGGYGTWQVAPEYPKKFAAIVPICVGGSHIDLPFMDRLKNLLIWAFHDSGDDVSSLSGISSDGRKSQRFRREGETDDFSGKISRFMGRGICQSRTLQLDVG